MARIDLEMGHVPVGREEPAASTRSLQHISAAALLALPWSWGFKRRVVIISQSTPITALPDPFSFISIPEPVMGLE